MIERLKCTPSEAAKELAMNPEIPELLAALAFQDAMRAREQWEDLKPSERSGLPGPSGPMDRLLLRFRSDDANAEIENAE